MEEKSYKNEQIAAKLEEILVFTDGSCSGNPGPGGNATLLVSKKENEEYTKHILISEYKDFTTNNEMELSAFLRAIKQLIIFIQKFKQVNTSHNCKFKIVSDSKYCIDAITLNWLQTWSENKFLAKNNTRRPNSDIWEEIYRLLYTNGYKGDIELEWVKGHQNVTTSSNIEFADFNNLVDNAAVKACTTKKDEIVQRW